MYKVTVIIDNRITEYCLNHEKAMQIKDIWATDKGATVLIEAL